MRGPSTSTCSSSARASPGSAAACHLQRAAAGHDVRHRRRARRLRRHVVDAPLPGRALRQRPVHVRVPLQALARPADRHRRRDPALPGRGHRRERAEAAHPLPAPRRLGGVVVRRARWTVHLTRTDTDEELVVTAGFVWMCQGYYRHNTGYTPEWPGFDRFARRGAPPAGVARRRRPLRQARRRDRLRRHRGDADPEHRRRLRARHDAAALADVLLRATEQQRAGRHAARPRRPRRVDARDRPPQDPQGAGRHHDDVVRAARDGAPVPHRRASGRCCPRASTSRRTSTRRTARGSSASPSCPTATSSRRSRRARPRSSPTRSRRSPRRHPPRLGRACSTPT